GAGTSPRKSVGRKDSRGGNPGWDAVTLKTVSGERRSDHGQSQPVPAALAGRRVGGLQAREQVPAAAVGRDQRGGAAAAAGPALRGADRQHRGLQYSRPGGP